MSKALIFLSN